MPLYDLACRKCEKSVEVRCNYVDIKNQKCECGEELYALPPTGTGFNLKGTGWYKPGAYPKRPAGKS